MTLTTVEFIRRFLIHVLRKSFHRICHSDVGRAAWVRRTPWHTHAAVSSCRKRSCAGRILSCGGMLCFYARA
jgi:hypothetical protein